MFMDIEVRRCVIALGTILSCMIGQVRQASADTSITYSLPTLVVTADGRTGSLLPVQFGFARKSDSKTPLTVAIEEDAPSGAGESLRASIWLACMAVALERNDDMRGVRISVSVPGEVDGGSAGGLVALALLSALDGRQLPDDFVFTGAILPDGTIGRVAGLPGKIRAAAKVKAKRVVLPAFWRFERDPDADADVDLKDLTSSLGMEFVQVENLEQAYAAVHRIPAKPVVRHGMEALALPAEMEVLLIGEYRRAIAAGDKLWQSLPAEEQEQIRSDTTSRQVVLSSRFKADVALRSGKLLAAAHYAGLWELVLQARERTVAGFKNASERGDVADLDAMVAAQLASVPGPDKILAEGAKRIPLIGSQFISDLAEASVLGLVEWSDRAMEVRAGQIRASEVTAEEKDEQVLNEHVASRWKQLLLAHLATATSASSVSAAEMLSRGLRMPGLAVDPVLVERMFYSAHAATYQGFEADTVKTVSNELQASRDGGLAMMAMNDPSLAMYLPIRNATLSIHKLVSEEAGLEGKTFTIVALAQAQATGLAMIAAINTRWGELDTEIDDDGEFRYGRTDLLSYLIATARENALANVAECRRLEVPCITPVFLIEDGDLSRDDRETDKVDVLSSYWQASLQAQTLTLLFGKR